MNSFNHYGFGSVGEWMFRTAGGIDTDGPGYKKIILRPQPSAAGDKGLSYVNASYDSIRGKISCEWKRTDAGGLKVKFTVPPNTTATASVPANDAASVTENGKSTTEVEGVKFLWTENGSVVYRLQSGVYEFESKN